MTDSKIRLDSDGTPYLEVAYKASEQLEGTAQEDAEKIFFDRLNQNGATIHLIPGKDNGLKLVIVTGVAKRQASHMESVILNSSRGSRIDVLGKTDPDDYISDAAMGSDEDPVSIGPT